MLIKVSTQIYRVFRFRGKYHRHPLLYGFLREGKIAQCIYKIEIKECEDERGEIILGPGYQCREGTPLFGGQKKISLNRRDLNETLIWPFIPYRSGTHVMLLDIVRFDPKRDILLDDYNTRLLNPPYRSPAFEVHTFVEWLLLVFAMISVAGACAEIANLIITILRSY